MSDYNDLKPGLRWARHKKTFMYIPWTRWVVVEITGKFPFMKATIVFDPGGDEDTDVYLSLDDPSDWQFGPTLDIPSEHWQEVREAPKSVPATYTLRNRSDD
jgi:hypothetical protein